MKIKWTAIEDIDSDLPFDSQSNDDRVTVWIVAKEFPKEIQYAHYSMNHNLFTTITDTYTPEDIIKWCNVHEQFLFT